MIKLSSSILSADYAHLGRDMALARDGGTDYIHLDVMDGRFVPNITIGVPVVESLRKATPLPLDVHLMIKDPDRYIDAFMDAGADIITIHVEALSRRRILNAVKKIRDAGKKAGLTLRPGTPVGRIEPFLGEIDLALVMTVEPGFGGQKLIESTIEKIDRLRTLVDWYAYRCEIEADGGINMENAAALVRAGANVIVAGSAIFDREDIVSAVREFKELLSSSEKKFKRV